MKGRNAPKPLRSEHFPMGLPSLGPVDQGRVDKANAIYANCARIIEAAIHMNIFVTIENPWNSLLWWIQFFDSLLQRGFVDVEFQHCRWNPKSLPSRAKWTRVRTNMPQLTVLSGKCTAGHAHLGWGILPEGGFATSLESAYPAAMCEAFAAVIMAVLSDIRFSFR